MDQKKIPHSRYFKKRRLYGKSLFQIRFYGQQKKYKNDKPEENPNTALVIFFMKSFIAAIAVNHYQNEDDKK